MSFVSDMLAKIGDLALKGAEFIQTLPGKLSSFIPAGRAKFLFFGLASALCILIVCLVAAVSGMNRRPDSLVKGGGSPIPALQPAIPPEELFFPEEPDFLPGPIPERERRKAWTAENAEPFWYNPLEKGEEPWRNRIESAIDELLEHVP
jgi:hypothetical protein